MNLVGKILIVLIFVMSLVFMAFAVAVYATHTNWKMRVLNDTPTRENPLGLVKQLQNSQNDVKQAELARARVVQQLDEVKDQKDHVLAKLEQRRQTLQTELDELSKTHTELEKVHRQAVADLEIAQKALDSAVAERNTLRDSVRKVQEQSDKHRNELVAKIDELNAARIDYNRVKSANAKLLQQISELQLVMQDAKINAEAVVKGQNPPRVNGVVLANRDNKWLEISIGEDDGIRNGHELEVFRQDKYLGKIRIVKSQSDRAVGQVIPESYVAPIQEGDRVRTKSQS